eukprot:m51a1_g4054 hypothetical protein (231) ;mRNA; f:709558-710455
MSLFNRSQVQVGCAPTAGSTTTSARWEGNSWTRASVCPGTGVVLEGTLRDTRMHLLTNVPPSSDLPGRFLALHIEVASANRRRYGADGVEIAPDQAHTRIEHHGYLSTSKTRCASEDDIKPQDVARLLGSERFPGTVSAASASTVEVWADAAKFIQSDFVKGRVVRLKTIGDSILVESVTGLDEQNRTLQYYAGESAVSQTWGDKIAQAKASSSSSQKNQGELRDDSEWD